MKLFVQDSIETTYFEVRGLFGPLGFENRIPHVTNELIDVRPNGAHFMSISILLDPQNDTQSLSC